MKPFMKLLRLSTAPVDALPCEGSAADTRIESGCGYRLPPLSPALDSARLPLCPPGPRAVEGPRGRAARLVRSLTEDRSPFNEEPFNEERVRVFDNGSSYPGMSELADAGGAPDVRL